VGRSRVGGNPVTVLQNEPKSVESVVPYFLQNKPKCQFFILKTKGRMSMKGKKTKRTHFQSKRSFQLRSSFDKTKPNVEKYQHATM
jgi:hypothetical protein